jgi:hypothetical protein
MAKQTPYHQTQLSVKPKIIKCHPNQPVKTKCLVFPKIKKKLSSMSKKKKNIKSAFLPKQSEKQREKKRQNKGGCPPKAKPHNKR